MHYMAEDNFTYVMYNITVDFVIVFIQSEVNSLN